MNKELNQKLCNAACSKESDIGIIAELMKQGGDPLGPIENDEESSALEELFLAASIEENGLDQRALDALRIFIENGMNVGNIRPAPDEDSTCPMWCLSFWCRPRSIEVLKLLLDNGLRADAFNEFMTHFIEDASFVSGSEINEDYLEYLICGFKMIMLAASYEHMISSNEQLRKQIEKDTLNADNSFVLHSFRDYDSYIYSIDMSTCINIRYGLNNALVTIREKVSGSSVWRFHI